MIDAKDIGGGRAPDYLGVVDAWRVWRVIEDHGGYRLASVFHPVIWPSGTALTAECLGRRSLARWIRRNPPHPAPSAPCECGIYAAGLEALEQYLLALAANRGAGRVLGEVGLWGEVVECERGLRASHAYPLHLYVPVDATNERWEILGEELGEAYGVPVELLPVSCTEATETLLMRQTASSA